MRRTTTIVKRAAAKNDNNSEASQKSRTMTVRLKVPSPKSFYLTTIFIYVLALTVVEV